MANLISNPQYKPELPVTSKNQPYIFESPETVINPVTGQTAISAASLQPATPINLPQPVQDTSHLGIIEGGQAQLNQLGTFKPKQSVAAAAEETLPESRRLEDLFKQYLGELAPPPSIAKEYESIYGVGPTQKDITRLESESAAKEAAVKSAQTELNMIEAQLRGIEAKYQAQNLQYEKLISGGEFLTAGTTEVLSRQQAESNRQAAIESLPLQGLALATQAKIISAQGDFSAAQKVLAQAQTKFDKVFELRIMDVQNQYNYRMDLYSKIYDFATRQEQTRIEEKRLKTERAYQESRENLKLAQDWARTAMGNNQADIAAQMTQLNPKSPTFAQDLAALQEKMVVEERKMVLNLANIYHDAGILPTDTLVQAQAKISTSRIYQAKVRGPQAPQEPTSIREYQFYAAQERAAGREPKSYDKWRRVSELSDITKNQILYNVGLPYTIVNNDGKLTDSSASELGAKSIDPQSAQSIIGYILAGHTLEETRQWLKSNGVDPVVLDIFMTTLQEDKSKISNPYN